MEARREHLDVVSCALYSGESLRKLHQMTGARRCTVGCFPEGYIGFPAHVWRELGGSNTPRKVPVGTGDAGEVLKSLITSLWVPSVKHSSSLILGFARNNGTSTPPLEIYARPHFEKETTGRKDRPKTPGDINWTNVSSHFDLEIVSSIKVRVW